LDLAKSLEVVEACCLIVREVVFYLEEAFSHLVAFIPFQGVAFSLLVEVFTLLCLGVEVFARLEVLLDPCLFMGGLFMVELK